MYNNDESRKRTESMNVKLIL